MKVKEAVPNCLISKVTLVKEETVSTELEFKAERSKDKRSIASSPVIRVYGSTGVEARALETTEIGDRNSP